MILEEAKNRNADIIGTSALLTSTMAEQKLEKLLAETGRKRKLYYDGRRSSGVPSAGQRKSAQADTV